MRLTREQIIVAIKEHCYSTSDNEISGADNAADAILAIINTPEPYTSASHWEKMDDPYRHSKKSK